MADGRVNGSLNLSRALGDMEYKQTKELGPAEQVQQAPVGQDVRVCGDRICGGRVCGPVLVGQDMRG